MNEAITKAEQWLAAQHAEAFRRGDQETLLAIEYLFRLTALQEQPAHVVTPLDLSNLLRHAFFAGAAAQRNLVRGLESLWTEYDPTHLATYNRILSALQPSPALTEVEAPVKQTRDYPSMGNALKCANFIAREILGKKP